MIKLAVLRSRSSPTCGTPDLLTYVCRQHEALRHAAETTGRLSQRNLSRSGKHSTSTSERAIFLQGPETTTALSREATAMERPTIDAPSTASELPRDKMSPIPPSSAGTFPSSNNTPEMAHRRPRAWFPQAYEFSPRRLVWDKAPTDHVRRRFLTLPPWTAGPRHRGRRWHARCGGCNLPDSAIVRVT